MKRSTLTVLMILVFSLRSVTVMASTHQNVIFGAFASYKSSTEITVTAGSGRCNDNFWEITSPIDVSLSSVLPSGEDFIYIYIDDSASSYPTPTIIGSTTEPAWSNSKVGWYNGNDRCIDVVWSPSSSSSIVQFAKNSNLECFDIDVKTVLQNGNPSGSWEFQSASSYIPVNANRVLIKAHNTDNDGYCDVEVKMNDSNYYNFIIATGYGGYAQGMGWLPIQRGWDRDFEWYGPNDDDNGFTIIIRGWQIER